MLNRGEKEDRSEREDRDSGPNTTGVGDKQARNLNITLEGNELVQEKEKGSNSGQARSQQRTKGI